MLQAKTLLHWSLKTKTFRKARNIKQIFLLLFFKTWDSQPISQTFFTKKPALLLRYYQVVWTYSKSNKPFKKTLIQASRSVWSRSWILALFLGERSKGIEVICSRNLCDQGAQVIDIHLSLICRRFCVILWESF